MFSVKRCLIFFTSLLVFLSGCKYEYNSYKSQQEHGINLVDAYATQNTVALFINLQKLSEDKIIFGHHHSTMYGINWRGDLLRSDVKDVSGSFPGLYGWDFHDLYWARLENYFDHYKQLIIDAKDRGGVNTFAWHYNNPVTGESFYDTTKAIANILPGGSHHNVYKKDLDEIAQFVKHLVGSDGRVIPIIFRPFHEFDGSWFWWGNNFCTEEEFIQLWRFTVDYLKNIRNVKNILYAFSPDRNFNSEDDYLYKYPGDDYVDVLGIDNYWDFKPEGEGINSVSRKLSIVSSVAKKRNKIAAFTETGLESIPDAKWWTEKLLPAISADSIKISYVMVWRNDNPKHHYAPYPGQVSEEDFRMFRKIPIILFEDDLPDLYRIK